MDTLHVDLISSGLDAASNGANVVVVYSTFVNMQRAISHCKRLALFVLFKWKIYLITKGHPSEAKKKTSNEYFKCRHHRKSYRYDFR